MPSHVARVDGQAIERVVAVQRFDVGADRRPFGLLAGECLRLSLGFGARGFVGRQPFADDIRQALEAGDVIGLHIGVGEQLDPGHAQGGVGLADRGQV